MASNPDFVQYILDQCARAGVVEAKKMFGDYTIYCDAKPVALVSDNGFYVKPTEAGRALLRAVDLRPPYEGAKPHFFIEDVDDADYMSALLKATCSALPAPKPRRKKTQ